MIQTLTGAYLAAATVTDLRWRRIPNVLSLAALVAGAGLHLFGLGSVSLSGFLWLLGLGYVFYVLGIFGGGDAKLVAVLGFLVGAEQAAAVLLYGLVWLVLWLLPARMLRYGWRRFWREEMLGLMLLAARVKLSGAPRVDACHVPAAPFFLAGFLTILVLEVVA